MRRGGIMQEAPIRPPLVSSPPTFAEFIGLAPSLQRVTASTAVVHACLLSLILGARTRALVSLAGSDLAGPLSVRRPVARYCRSHGPLRRPAHPLLLFSGMSSGFWCDRLCISLLSLGEAEDGVVMLCISTESRLWR